MTHFCSPLQEEIFSIPVFREVDPEGQGMQEVCPSLVWYDPAGHGKHAGNVPFKSPRVPGGQFTEINKNKYVNFKHRLKFDRLCESERQKMLLLSTDVRFWKLYGSYFQSVFNNW